MDTNKLVQEVLDSSREWFNEGERWIPRKWYDTPNRFPNRVPAVVKAEWYPGCPVGTHTLRFNAEQEQIKEHATGGCLIGGVDHNIWLVAKKHDLTAVETFQLDVAVYKKIWATVYEQYPDYALKWGQLPTDSFLYNWNDTDNRKYADVDRLLDKAARSLDDV